MVALQTEFGILVEFILLHKYHETGSWAIRTRGLKYKGIKKVYCKVSFMQQITLSMALL